MTIPKRITQQFLSLSGFVIILSSLALVHHHLASVKARTLHWHYHELAQINLAQGKSVQASLHGHRYAVTCDPLELERLNRLLHQIHRLFHEMTYCPEIAPFERKMLAALENEALKFQEYVNRDTTLKRRLCARTSKDWMFGFDVRLQRFNKILSAYETNEFKDLRTINEGLTGRKNALDTTLLILSAVLFLWGLLSTLGTIRVYRKNMVGLLGGLRRIKNGDMESTIILDREEEFLEITREYREMARVLRHSTEGLKDEVRAATVQLVASNNELLATISELEKEKLKLSTIMENIADGLVILDPHRRVTAISPMAAQYLGVTREQVMDMTITGAPPAPELAPLFEVCRRAVPSECGQSLNRSAEEPREAHSERRETQEVTLEKPEIRVLHITASDVFGEDCKLLGEVRVMHDITALRELDQLQSEFVSNVSHELRTPLTAILGSTDLLFKGGLGPMTSEQERFLGIIRSNADRLYRLILDLLDLSRIESRRFTVFPRLVPISALVEQVVNSLRPVLDSKQIVLDVRAPRDLPHVWADDERICQVLTNLLSNAVKFSPEGGVVRIWAGARSGAVVVEVSDKGIGVDPKHQGRIFDRFYQVDGSMTRRSGGTGLGLAIAKGIMEAHGGAIWVNSSPGQGTTFAFSLPLPGSGEKDLPQIFQQERAATRRSKTLEVA
ncbi:MAG: PAS domain-containing protein [Armatimonadetes bacterium]|nr:PAS domain-containing protein [Armatimonadota bacterium]